MAIIYPISLPTEAGIQKITLTMAHKTAVSESPFTGQQQVYQHSGEHWQAAIVLSKMLRADAEQWITALAALRGQFGTFLLGDPVGAKPRGTISGAVVVDGAGQSGLEVSVRGMTVGTTLLAGDYLQIGGGLNARLYKNLQDVTAPGSGLATFDIWPRLRDQPADGVSVVTSNPVGLFRLAQPDSPFTYVSPTLASIQFSAREAI